MRSATSKATRQSKFMIFIRAPFGILIKARDFYVKCMADCAGRVGYDGAVICPAASISHLTQSFGVASSNGSSEELRGIDMHWQPEMRDPGRSYSVGIGRIGRIEEDKPCDFVEETADLLYPRTRSYAVRRRNVVYY